MQVEIEVCEFCEDSGLVIGDAYDEYGRCEVGAGNYETCICQIEQ